MNTDDQADALDPRWRAEFERFVQTGEAGEEFLQYMDETPACVAAVNQVLVDQLHDLDALNRRSVSPNAAVGWLRSSATRRNAVTAGLCACCLILGAVTLFVGSLYRNAVARADDFRSQLAQRASQDDEDLARFARAWTTSEPKQARLFVAESIYMKWNHLRSETDAPSAIAALRDYLHTATQFEYPAFQDDDRDALRRTLSEGIKTLEKRLTEIDPNGQNSGQVRSLVGADTDQLRKRIAPVEVATYDKSDLPK